MGEKPRPDYDLADWVLGHFSEEDAKAVNGRHADVEAAARLIMAGRAVRGPEQVQPVSLSRRRSPYVRGTAEANP